MITLTLSLFLLCQPVALECVTMINEDRINPPFTENGVLNINSLDPLDPVHLRRARDRKDFSYDGDLGRQHEDYCRDNDIGYGNRSGFGDWKQIATALPVIEAPSIVAEHPASAEQTLAYLRKTESEG